MMIGAEERFSEMPAQAPAANTRRMSSRSGRHQPPLELGRRGLSSGGAFITLQYRTRPTVVLRQYCMASLYWMMRSGTVTSRPARSEVHGVCVCGWFV